MNRLDSYDRETDAALDAAKGKTIASVGDVGAHNELLLTFTDGSRLRIFDGGQDCCESRYMVCDDDLSGFVDAELLSAEVAEAPPGKPEKDDCHDVQFLRVETTKGTIVCSNHNEHNGYYAGFGMKAVFAGAS